MQENNSGSKSGLSYYQFAKESLEHGLHKELRSRMLGTILIKKGIISPEQLEQALKQHKQSDERLGSILIRLGYATEEDILGCLAIQAGVPYISLAGYQINGTAARLISKEAAEKYSMLVIDRIGDSLLVAAADPMDREAKAELQKLLPGVKINYYLTSPGEISQKINEIYG